MGQIQTYRHPITLKSKAGITSRYNESDRPIDSLMGDSLKWDLSIYLFIFIGIKWDQYENLLRTESRDREKSSSL